MTSAASFFRGNGAVPGCHHSYRTAQNTQVRTEAEKLYAELCGAGIEVLLDDRDDRPGVMFADMELIGIPHRVVYRREKLEDTAIIEYQGRQDEESQAVPFPSQNIIDFVKSRIGTGLKASVIVTT